MDRVSLFLPNVLRKRGLADHAAGALATYVAKQWVEKNHPHLLSFISIPKMENGVLSIACTHSIALQEFQACTADLLAYLRLECPFGGVREIRTVRE